jgi:hypothetical protein
MNNITLTTSGNNKVLINWDNVNFVVRQESVYHGQAFAEINMGRNLTVGVQETIEQIEKKLSK